jgi:sporulation protein YlmC with PRC-barrel domain
MDFNKVVFIPLVIILFSLTGCLIPEERPEQVVVDEVGLNEKTGEIKMSFIDKGEKRYGPTYKTDYRIIGFERVCGGEDEKIHVHTVHYEDFEGGEVYTHNMGENIDYVKIKRLSENEMWTDYGMVDKCDD